MASVSEYTFGQRYTKARELVEYLEEVPTFSPTESSIQPANFAAFLDDINNANTDVAAKLSTLQTERESRLQMFKNTDTGLIKRCAQIRDYIASFHPQGKKALDYKKVQKTVMLMRGIRLSKKPPAGENQPKTVSTSERSYGSMLKAGKDILEVIKTVPGYAPSNTALTVANFTTALVNIDSKNSVVAEKLEQYDNSVEARGSLYKELADKVNKIKLALAAQYGRQSNEYKDAVKY